MRASTPSRPTGSDWGGCWKFVPRPGPELLEPGGGARREVSRPRCACCHDDASLLSRPSPCGYPAASEALPTHSSRRACSNRGKRPLFASGDFSARSSLTSFEQTIVTTWETMGETVSPHPLESPLPGMSAPTPTPHFPRGVRRKSKTRPGQVPMLPTCSHRANEPPLAGAATRRSPMTHCACARGRPQRA